jgi:membrane protein DedA with SNARE-associated domain
MNKMNEFLKFVAQYGYLVIFFGVLIEQIGVPLPSNFLLITAGVLIGLGQIDPLLAIFLAVFAALLGDTIWFYIGRRTGYRVLGFLCRISLEPDICVNNAKGIFVKHGERSLLIAKFVPGFSTFAQPVAGASKMSLPRFLIFDGVGSLFWVLVFVGLGYIFSDQFEQVTEYATSFGWWFGAILIFGLGVYVGWKVFKRQQFLRSLRTARINPEDLKTQIDAGEEITVIDLREKDDFDLNPHLIPTALRMSPEEIEDRHEELPRDRDIILYCT